MDKIEESLHMIKCNKCGKYSSIEIVKIYGTCLCGNVLDERAKFKYNLKMKLLKGRNLKCLRRKTKEMI